MRIEEIIQLLKVSGINSKHKVVNHLENMTKDDVLELIQSLQEILRKMSI